MKKFAFTLAETLIVIGVIGIVSALTLPNLNSSTGNKEKVAKVKKIYQNLNDAYGRAEAVYGPIDDWFVNDNATTAKKRFAEETNNKGEITITATLTDDELLSESSDREKAIIVPYSKIAKVFLTENFYMIQTTDQMIYAFKKGAFIAGKEESFLPFVNEIISKNNRKHK